MNTEQSRSRSDRRMAIGSLVADFLVPISVALIALVGHFYTTAIKERETRAKFVELAITILKSEPTPATEQLRKWAIEIINANSEIKLTGTTGEKLVNEISLSGTFGSAQILKVLIRSGDELQISGQNFGGLAGAVYLSIEGVSGGSVRYPLNVIDWESSRIKVSRAFRMGDKEKIVEPGKSYEIRVETKDGRVTAAARVE